MVLIIIPYRQEPNGKLLLQKELFALSNQDYKNILLQIKQRNG